VEFVRSLKGDDEGDLGEGGASSGS